MRRRAKRPAVRKDQLHLNKSELDRLLEEATADCHDESEQVTGIYTMIENDLEFPFETQVLGTAVVVEGIDLTDRDEIVAICRRGRERQRIGLNDLPLPSPPPPGAQWIEVYRHWANPGGSTDWEDDDSE